MKTIFYAFILVGALLASTVVTAAQIRMEVPRENLIAAEDGVYFVAENITPVPLKNLRSDGGKVYVIYHVPSSVTEKDHVSKFYGRCKCTQPVTTEHVSAGEWTPVDPGCYPRLIELIDDASFSLLLCSGLVPSLMETDVGGSVQADDSGYWSGSLYGTATTGDEDWEFTAEGSLSGVGDEVIDMTVEFEAVWKF